MDRKNSLHLGCLCLLALSNSFLPVALGRGLPTVDPGLFVISGVGTCGNGEGYCLLGLDCTLDQDFAPDDQNGHCDGLKSAFTPSANFVCCKDSNITSDSAIIKPKEKPVIKPVPISILPSENENEIENVLSKVVDSINNSFPYTFVDNATENFQPSKVVNNYYINDSGDNDDNEDDDDDDDDDIADHEENDNVQNNDEFDKREVTDESPNGEEQMSTTESSSNADVEEMTEKDVNSLVKDNNFMNSETFDEVSLKSEEKYDSKEEPLNGDAKWLVPPNEEQQSHFEEDKIQEYKTESNDNNEVNAKLEEQSGIVKSGTVVVEQEREQGQNDDGNNEPNSDSTTDNVQNTEAGILNADVTVNNQFDMTNPPTDSITVESVTANTGYDFHYSSPQHPDGSKDPDNIASGKAQETKDPKSGDHPIEKPCGMSARCISLVRFSFDNSPLCYGNPLQDNWVITSASCALRIFRMGMFNVSVLAEEDTSWPQSAKVKTIIVHENYRNKWNDGRLHIEDNDMGLVRIQPGLGWELCRACLPHSNQVFEGARCATHPIAMTPPNRLRFNDHLRVGALCEGNTELLPGGFLSLPCKQSAWIPRAVPSLTPSIGLPLRCDGLLAGVQIAEGVGIKTYNPVAMFLNWIELNTHSTPTPKQIFRRLKQ